MGGPPATADAYFAEFGFAPVPRHEGAGLAAGTRVDGPAIIREPTTTVVVYPGSSAFVTPFGNYILEVKEDAAATRAAREEALAR